MEDEGGGEGIVDGGEFGIDKESCRGSEKSEDSFGELRGGYLGPGLGGITRFKFSYKKSHYPLSLSDRSL